MHIRLLSSAETASSAIGVLEERTRGMSIAEIWDKYGYQIIAAILVLALGYFIAKAAGRFVKKYFAKKDAATGFTKFTVGIIKFVVYFSALLFAASIMDIPVTSVLALFSALALAFSLAVKDTLALFASGVMIVLSKPFVVGDFIEVPSENVTGYAEEVGFAHTHLRTADCKEVIIPNSIIASNTVLNYSRMKVRRLEMVFPVDYASDIALAKKLILEAAEEEPLVEKDRGKTVMVTNLASSAIEILFRAYVPWDSVVEAKGKLNEKIIEKFRENNVKFPFNQLDVHVN